MHISVHFKLRKLTPVSTTTTTKTKSDNNFGLPKPQEEQESTDARRSSYKDLKASSSSLSFTGHESISSNKRPSLHGKSHNNVMGRIKDRTGIPV